MDISWFLGIPRPAIWTWVHSVLLAWTFFTGCFAYRMGSRGVPAFSAWFQSLAGGALFTYVVAFGLTYIEFMYESYLIGSWEGAFHVTLYVLIWVGPAAVGSSLGSIHWQEDLQD